MEEAQTATASGFEAIQPGEKELIQRGQSNTLSADDLLITSSALKPVSKPPGLPYEFIELPALDEPRLKVSEIVAQFTDVATAASLLYYLGTLGYCSVKAYKSGDTYFVPSLFLTAKICNYLMQALDHGWRLASGLSSKRDPAKRLRIVGDNVPTVDLIITVCGEQVEIVVDTVHAACTQDYPTSKYRVIVSDDGEDDKLQSAVIKLKEKYTHLVYFRRVKPTNRYHGAKAGNLNSVFLETSGTVTSKMYDSISGPAEFFAVFDADMMPDAETLRALVAQAVQADDIAMVTLPQNFMNVPASDPLNQDMRPHADDEEVMRDRLDAAWCPGSGFLLRRTALQICPGKIFPENSIAEDVLFSWLLQGAGLRTIYLRERLQWGLQPNSLVSHIKQRIKWCVGHINNSLFLQFCLNHPLLEFMKPMQRLPAIMYSIRPWAMIPKFFSWVILGGCVVSGAPLIAASTPEEIHWIAEVYLVFNLCTRANENFLCLKYGYLTFRRTCDYNQWMASYLAAGTIREVICKHMGVDQLGFEATGSMVTDINERDDSTRPPLFKRIMLLHREAGILYGPLFVYIMIVCTWVKSMYAVDFNQMIVVALFPGLGFEQILAFITPVCYAINPPSDVPRELYMTEDRETGVSRASQAARNRKFPKRAGLVEVPHTLTTLWAIHVWWVTR